MPLLIETRNAIVAKLADMAELEQLKAENSYKAAQESAENFGQQAQHLAKKDRHAVRAVAFLEAARVIMEWKD